MKAPVAERIEHVTEIHGRELVDPYHWLRQRESPEVMAYLEAENAYCDEVLAPEATLREALFVEMKERIKEADLTAPARHGGWLYQMRTLEGMQYGVHLRRRAPDGEEEILLDLNAMAHGKDFFAISGLEPSPDHRLLAYGIDDSGSEEWRLAILDTATGDHLPDSVERCSGQFAWAADGALFYVLLDETHRPHRVMRHVLGTPASADTEVFVEEDAIFVVGVHASRDGAWIVIHSHSYTSGEVLLVDAEHSAAPAEVFVARRPDVEVSAVFGAGRAYLLTNEGAVNFRLLETEMNGARPTDWVELVPGRDDVLLEGVDRFRQHLVLWERKRGVPHLRWRRHDEDAFREHPFPEAAFSLSPGANDDWNETLLRFHTSSLATPATAWDLDLDTGEARLVKRREILGGFDPEDYVTDQIEVPSHDGALVPLSLVHRKDTPLDGTAPCLLYGYGAYGISEDPYFASTRLSLLDRGWIWALAHVRGGEYLGRPWYEDGKLEKKTNSFHDFVACARHLVSSGRTSVDRLACEGGSAGGLLVGASVNMAPDAFAAAILDVPFVDVINTMLDESLPLTAQEFEEWGNPKVPADFETMMAYSPYDNVEAKDYPAMFLLGGLNDPRVQYWEPAKMAAKLRATKTDDRLLLLHTYMGAGHGGASGRFDSLREVALQYAFLLHVIPGGKKD